MVELIIKILNVISPIFILMAVGSYVYINKILDSNTGSQINDFIYRISMPVMMFYFMSNTDTSLIDMDFVWLVVIYCLIVTAVAVLINDKFFSPSNKQNAVGAIAITFSNSAYLGLPMAFFAFGEKGMPPAIISSVLFSMIFIACTLILGNVDGVKNSQRNKILFLFDVIKSVLLSPMIFMSILGMVVAFYSIQLPQFINSSLELIANANIGIALIIIGITLTRLFVNNEISYNKKFIVELIWANIFKLVLAPFIAFLIIYPFDINIIWKSVFILQASLSTGLVSYIMSSTMKIYKSETSLIIFTTTFISLFTLPIVLGLLFNWT